MNDNPLAGFFYLHLYLLSFFAFHTRCNETISFVWHPD
jgi:hypothetical protein